MRCCECDHNVTIALVNQSGWAFAWVPACNAENPIKRRSIWEECPEWCPLEKKK